MFKTKSLVAGVALASGLTAGSAFALSSVDTVFFLGEDNFLSDNDAENHINRDQDPFITVGDTLRGIISWDNNTGDVSGVQNAIGGATTNELSGIFEVVVTDRTKVGDGPDGNAGTADDQYFFKFAPYAPFASEFNLPTGAMVALWEDVNGNDFKRGGAGETVATLEAKATDGVLRWVWGFSGLDADEQWVAVGSQAAAPLPGATQVALFNFQLSILLETFPFTFGQVETGCNPANSTPSLSNQNPCLSATGDRLVDVNGGGSVVGPTGTTPYAVFSNSDATVHPMPEPFSLGLLSVGLLGMGVARRWRKV